MSTLSASNETNRAYHHGDLRSALIAAGLKALEQTDADALSLRQIARDVGVSATAVYRHFPDKRALLAALADEGLAMLAREQQAASDAAGGGKEGFTATGRAYVRFAIAHPALFRLAFTHAEVADAAKDDEAGRMLRANAEALSDGTPDAARRLQVHSWALVHGLAMLILDGRLPADDALIDAVIGSHPLQPGRSSDESP